CRQRCLDGLEPSGTDVAQECSNSFVVGDVRAGLLDVSLHRAPARKTISTSELQLCVGQSGARVLSAQFLKKLLGCLLQPLEIGVSRECFGHATFLLMRPASAKRAERRSR